VWHWPGEVVAPQETQVSNHRCNWAEQSKKNAKRICEIATGTYIMSKLSKSVGILMEDSEDPKKGSKKKKRGQTNVLGCLNKQENMSWELSNTT